MSTKMAASTIPAESASDRGPKGSDYCEEEQGT